ITTQNTVCDNTFSAYNGSLTVSVAGGDGNYDYVWHAGNDVNVASPIGQTTATATGLQEGFYWVEVNDNTTAGNDCSATAVIELTAKFDVISVAIADITITPASDCAGGNTTGEIEVTDVLVGGLSQGTGGYNFTFFDASDGDDISNSANAESTTNPYASVAPGDYFVVATDATTGCSSAPVQVTVGQDDAVPVLIFTEISPNSACDAVNYNGGLRVEVSDGVGGTRNTADFTFQWYEGSQPLGATVDNSNGGNQNEIYTVQDGNYTVEVTVTSGAGLGCSAIGTSSIESSIPALVITDANITASNSCNPDENGSIEITSMTSDGITLNTESALDDFTFELFDESFVSQGAFDTPGSTTNLPSTSGLTEGVYYVVASNANGCDTPPFLVEIDDNSSKPVIEFNMELADNSCNGTDATGSLSVTVPGEDIANYTIEWYTGDLSAFGITAVDPSKISTSNNKSIISDVAAGQYSVSVTDNTIPGKNCVVLGTGVIENDFADITVPVITTTANQNCVGPFDGTIEGIQVNENGTLLSPTATAANYTFTYYDEDLNPLGSTTTLEGGTYYVIAENSTTGCTSAATFAEVEDNLDNLEIAFDTTPNTYCTGAGSFDGTITATVTLNGNTITGRYDFVWYEGNTVGVGLISTGISSGTTDNISIVSNLESKQYTVVVEDNITGCEIIGIYNVPELLDVPSVSIPDSRLSASALCTPGAGNGAVTLTNSDITPGNLSDYDLQWYTDASLGATLFDTQLGTDGDIGQQTGLQAGDYYIVATHRTTGCSSAVARFDIEDFGVNPEIEFSQTPDVGCTSSLGLGSITALADGFNSTSGAGTYTWQWYEGSSTAFPVVDDADGGQTSTISNQSFGTYTVVVTNTTTDCSVEQKVTLEQEERYPIVTGISADPQTACNANGGVAVTEVSYDGSPVALSNFTFAWTTEAGSSLGDGTSPATSGSLPAGSYLVTVTHTTTGCVSEQVTEVVVLDEIVLPDVTITQDSPDTNCSAANGTGQLSATADGFSVNPYSFEWYNGSTATGTPFATTATIETLDAGTYTVLVANSNTGCENTLSFELESEPIEPKIDSFVTTDVSICTDPGNGMIEITGITPDNVSSYTYELFDIDPDTPGALAMTTTTTGTFSNVDVGTFWVVAEHITTGCTSPSIQLDIEDVSIPPVITQEDIVLQSNCDPAIPNGTMTVAGDGSTDPAFYSFAWYEGALPVSGIASDVISNTAEATGLAAGIYSVVVTDLTTGCSNEESFRMADDIDNPILISTSFTANNNCINPDGEMGMFVINAQSNKEYEFYWFEGNVTNPDPANATYTGVAVLGVMHGTYTAYALDVTGGCESDPVVIEVPDNTNTDELDFDLIEIEPLTNCDPDRPNGIVGIEPTIPSDKTLSDFTFYWYLGETTDEAARIDQSVSTFARDSLTSTSYTVQMIDDVTGCMIDKSIFVSDQTTKAPTPLVVVESDRTNCSTPNGEATITSDLLEYTFEWTYNGTVLGGGSSYADLDVGDYSVVATEVATGCTSDATSFSISDNTIPDPEFEVVITQNPVCSANNGEVHLEGVEIDSIAWSLNSTKEEAYTAGLFSNDLTMIEAPPGEYTVYFVDGFGCDNTADFELGTDVIIYNAVSDNGDGMNDIFLIDCAEFFPENNCKIFNRNGQLIYEIDNYDNSTNVFTGESNKGATVGSQGLPEGTYFYIFDKGDGSDVYQGYLELVR
ncbi:MAG: gliding motility-associated C-terminal domain-containing protein, partial [Cyclobacteriaceae bacterium]